MIYIFTKKEILIKSAFSKEAQFFAMPALARHTPEDESLSYIDVTGLNPADFKKALSQAKKVCKNSLWGIIDPKGSVKDPAAMFFEGACDYLGPSFFKCKKSIDPKRLKAALKWRKAALAAISGSSAGVSAASGAKASAKAGANAASSFLKSGIKLPPMNVFPGWKKLSAGKTMPFYLLYCSLQGRHALDTRLEEKTISHVHKRFLSCLDNNFLEGDGLLWMNSGKDCLFLLPPKAKSAEAAITACIRMIISAPLISLETLGISIPVNFVFALHYGSISYKPPGKTGTVVSDAVNFIFHLGAKKAQVGRLTVSGELPDGTIPKALEDCFLAAGTYEGRQIWHTKKFGYAKPWV